MLVALRCVSDAAIIKQQYFDIRHVASAIKQLSELAEGWRKGIDKIEVFVKQLVELRDRAASHSRMLVENGRRYSRGA